MPRSATHGAVAVGGEVRRRRRFRTASALANSAGVNGSDGRVHHQVTVDVRQPHHRSVDAVTGPFPATPGGFPFDAALAQYRQQELDRIGFGRGRDRQHAGRQVDELVDVRGTTRTSRPPPSSVTVAMSAAVAPGGARTKNSSTTPSGTASTCNETMS